MAKSKSIPSRPEVAGAQASVDESQSSPGVALDSGGFFSSEADSSELSALLQDICVDLKQAHAFAVTVSNALEAISADGCVEAGGTLTACGNVLWDQIERLEWAVENGRIVGDRVTVPKWVQP